MLQKQLINMNPYTGYMGAFYYCYDDLGRLDTVKSHFGATQTEATYEYFASGKVKRTVLGGVQGMDYRYNERDWLEYINDPNPNGSDPGSDGSSSIQPAKTGTKIPSIMKNVKRSNAKSVSPQVAEEYLPGKVPETQKVKKTIADRFAMQLVYDGSSRGGMAPPYGYQPQYNGNISSIIYRYDSVYKSDTYLLNGDEVVDSSDVVAYNYFYDGANRLVDNWFNWYSPMARMFIGTDAYWEGMSYDPNGNIMQINRTDNIGLGNPINNQYIPNTNKLLIFGNDSAKNNISIYRYDGNGSMTSDPNAGINFVIYDCNNMPLAEYKGNTRYDYIYDANETRVSKKVGTNTTYYTQGASGNAEMETIVGTSSTTNRYYIWGLDHLGHITSAMHYYYLKDHLGSIRMTINKNGKVVSYNDYYPYGSIMPMRSMNMAMADERYKFIGKEQDAETGLYLFGPRPFDSNIGRFLNPDRLKELSPQYSPYCYGFDNPLRYLDPTGLSGQDVDNPKPPGDEDNPMLVEGMDVTSTSLVPEGYYGIYCYGTNTIQYHPRDPKAIYTSLNREFRTMALDIVRNTPYASDLYDLIKYARGLNNNTYERDKIIDMVKERIIEKMKSNGIAITPEVDNAALGMAVGLMSVQNPVAVADPVSYRFGYSTGSDTAFYDAFRNSNGLISEVIDHNQQSKDGVPLKIQFFLY